jgi:antitoxin component YwqK of YwqJK toxin-antitoxin module
LHNGKLEGERKLFYLNGKTKRKELYDPQNRLTGKALSYDSLGNKTVEENYLAGQLTGIRTSYYDDGTLAETHTYRGGRKEGPFISYHLNGKQNTLGQFKADRANGLFVYFDMDGKKVREKIYKMDLLVKEKQF